MMFRASLLLASAVIAVVAVQGPYDQCGGQNWSGGTTCVSGWTCVYQNPYYSQCLQSTSSSSSTTSKVTTSGSTATQGPYDQCGGQNWSGGTTCTAGWTCVYQNPYYSQCLQNTGSGTSSGSSTVSSSATTSKAATSISTSGSTAAQGPYAQCGGQNWSGGTTCTAGWTCVYQNPYYSQCLQSTGSGTGSSTTLSSVTTSKVATSTSTSGSTATQGPYDQCGGQNWSGGTTCTAGWTCVYQNPYYSQCLQTTNPSSQSSSSIPSSASTKSTASSSTSTRSTTSSSSPSSTSTAGQGVTYKASFTHYGSGDSFGSPNCNTDTAACGFYTYPGYSAAVSQNLYGAGPGAGAGPACGTCWRLVGETDSSGNKLSNAGTTIVVMVNNLCPAQGNPLCSQNGLSGTNSVGANVNFDLCSDSGAQAAFFGNDGVGLAVGTATQVDCSQWSGTVVH